MKLWSGRFKENTSELMDRFNSSIGVDARLYREDIEGSLIHSEMLKNIGLLTNTEFQEIQEGLKAILLGIENGSLTFDPEDEDIHMAVERLLSERIGAAGKKLHTARSRNDQVAFDLRWYLKKEISKTKELVHDLMGVLYERALEETGTLMPGYTHLQRAQPIRLAFYLMAYFEMFKRDFKRLDNAYGLMDELPLGAGALAGTSYETDREFIRNRTGFERVMANAMDAVSDRDYLIESASVLSIGMMHLSRLSEEIINYSSKEFAFFEVSEAFSTGSSIMPQKKNPDAAELIRGKTASVYGRLVSLMVMMKGLPLAYNKDMQEDKKQIFEALADYQISLSVMTGMMASMGFNRENMLRATSEGYLNATDLADHLAKKGMPFREAHDVVGRLVAHGIKEGCALEEIDLSVFRELIPGADEEVYEVLKIENCVESKRSRGSTNLESVLDMLNRAQEWLEAVK